MARKTWILAVLVAVVALAQAQPAAAKYQFSYAVKFVCGYNPTNVGVSLSGSAEGEPTVKFGNYATDVNIYNPSITDAAIIGKQVIVLVYKGTPQGREPRYQPPTGFDNITLPLGNATMDDCNRIAELIYGSPVPTPLPLTIGFLIIQSTVDLDVTAVYTSQACSNWVVSPTKLECLDATGRQQGVSNSIDVEQIKTRQLF